MQTKDRKIGLPYFSFYTEHFKEFLELLGLEVIEPIPINEETTKLGVKHSVEMFCFPFKIVLGNSIQLIEKGANTIVMYNSCGKCKLRHYHKLIDLKLHQLGYRFEMVDIKPYDFVPIPFPSFMNKLVYLSGKSKWEISRIIRKKWMDVKAEENKRYCREFGRTNIVITGEIYSALEEGVNHNIKQQLENLGVIVHSTLNVRALITGNFKSKEKRILRRRALSFLDKVDIGGHGLHTIEDCLYWGEKGIDGIIHIMPLTCLKGDTGITVEGYRTKLIKNIKVGDEVLTHKGRFKKVTKTFCRDYKGNLLEINCGGTSKLKITPNHLILAIKREKVGRASKKKSYKNLIPKFIEARNLNYNDLIAIPIPKLNNQKKYLDCKERIKINYLHKRKYKPIGKFYYTPEILRFLGYYLAEGCIIKHDNMKYFGGIILSFSNKERNYIDEVRNIMNKNFDTNILLYSYPHQHKLSQHIVNSSLAHIVLYLGGEYSWNKILHKELMELPPPLQLEVVRGFFRGDASIQNDKYGCRYRGTTASKQLASQMFWILIRNKIKPSILEYNRINKKRYNVVSINTYDEFKKIEPKFNLIKKKSNPRFIMTEEFFLLPIRKIKTKKFIGKVYNLEVEKDNSYIANFLTVHNCHPEILVEEIVDYVCKENKTPLLKIKIDETSSPLNTATRLETFVELIKRKKEGRLMI